MTTNKISILILCTYQSTYVLQLYQYVKKYYPNIRYSLFTQDSVKSFYLEKLALEEGEQVFSFGSHEYLCCVEARKLPRFDIIHSLWMEHFWGEAAGILRKKCDAWFNSVGGSDLYRESSNTLWKILQKRIISHCDWISSEGEETRQKFHETYGAKYDKIPHSVIRFGVDILDYFAESKTKDSLRVKYGIPVDKYCIMCGTNARVEHQHTKILEQINQLPDNIKDRCCLLIPMTYSGTEDYIQSIETKAKLMIDTVVLRDYLTAEEMAELAILTDIMIHVQTTDQLSSVMLSHMYHGNVVIAGSWLPYDDLRRRGIQFISIDKLEELTDTLIDSIDHFHEYQKDYQVNKAIIYEMSSWQASAKEWYHVYTKLLEGKEKNDYPI